MPKLTGIAVAQDVDNALQMVASSHVAQFRLRVISRKN
jgi:hypothetical protein